MLTSSKKRGNPFDLETYGILFHFPKLSGTSLSWRVSKPSVVFSPWVDVCQWSLCAPFPVKGRRRIMSGESHAANDKPFACVHHGCGEVRSASCFSPSSYSVVGGLSEVLDVLPRFFVHYVTLFARIGESRIRPLHHRVFPLSPWCNPSCRLTQNRENGQHSYLASASTDANAFST